MPDLYAPLPDGVYLCQTCTTGQGYIWPIASNGDPEHYFVERCDMCDRFESDAEAADFIAAKLTKEGFKFDRGEKEIVGGSRFPQPYIENVEEV